MPGYVQHPIGQGALPSVDPGRISSVPSAPGGKGIGIGGTRGGPPEEQEAFSTKGIFPSWKEPLRDQVNDLYDKKVAKEITKKEYRRQLAGLHDMHESGVVLFKEWGAKSDEASKEPDKWEVTGEWAEKYKSADEMMDAMRDPELWSEMLKLNEGNLDAFIEKAGEMMGSVNKKRVPFDLDTCFHALFLDQ